jgi:hypothetical protein
MADLHERRARVARQRGDATGAFEAYGRALVNAYAFLGAPHPPDVYTRTHYERLGRRVVEYVRELAASGRQAEAVRGLSALHRVWQAAPGTVAEPAGPWDRLLATASPDELAPYLFPPPPTDDELAGEAGERCAHLAHGGSRPSTGPAPPRAAACRTQATSSGPNDLSDIRQRPAPGRSAAAHSAAASSSRWPARLQA